MEVWKIIFLSKWVICRFHVNLPGSNPLRLVVYLIIYKGRKIKPNIPGVRISSINQFVIAINIGG